MHNKEIFKSNYKAYDNILVVHIASDANKELIYELKKLEVYKWKCIIIAIDNSDENTLIQAEEILGILRTKTDCVIGICMNLVEDDQYGNPDDLPIELQIKSLKEKMETMVIIQKNHRYKDVIDFLMEFENQNEEEGECALNDSASAFKNCGFAYYNKVYNDEVRFARRFLDFSLFDSFFICPFYVCETLFCKVKRILDFEFDGCSIIDYPEYILKYLNEYFPPKVNKFAFYKPLETEHTMTMCVEYLFCGIDDKYYNYTKDYNWKYPDCNENVKSILDNGFKAK